MKKIYMVLTAWLAFVVASTHGAEKSLIDYFQPMPIRGALVSNVWGAPGVFPRDPQNGLEDMSNKQWCYWDGQIIKGPDGKFHMFASRWPESKGHNGWWGSFALRAESDHIMAYLVKPIKQAVQCSQESSGTVDLSRVGPMLQALPLTVGDRLPALRSCCWLHESSSTVSVSVTRALPLF